MSAHRRPGSRGETPSPRRAVAVRGRRRAGSRPVRGLMVVFGLSLLVLIATAGQSVVTSGWNDGADQQDGRRITLASVPADTPELGLVYAGLDVARTGALCAGSYELVTPETCTHGPDAVPAGFKVGVDVAPITEPAPEPRTPSRESAAVPSDSEIVRDEGGTALTPGAPALIPDAAPGQADFIMGSHDVACEGDGRSGKRVQVLYLHEFGTPSRYTRYLGSIRAWTAGIDKIVDDSAGETGGSRHVRFVTTPQCRVDVAEVQVPDDSLSSFRLNIEALATLGYNRTDRKYLVFADTHVYCGIGTFIADRRAGSGNRNNGGPSYGRIDAGCWGAPVATHELTHTLGAVLQDSPNSSGGGHCTDEYDLLCGPDTAAANAGEVRTVCPKKHEQRLDCNHDDYFSTDPKPGSYLADNWNVAQSEFLLASDGGEDLPPGVPTAGVQTVNAAAQVQAVVEFRDPTSTSVRLTWSAAAEKATYQVAVDDVVIATTTSTRARLIGLRPDAKYRVTIADATHKYLAKGEAQTAPAARPAQNSWFVMTNSLTEGSADLYAARTANGTPIVLGGADGGAQQQWKLSPAGDSTYTLQSRATSKCVAPQDGNPVAGAPLVQVDCSSDGSQRWLVLHSDHGFALGTKVGGLVIGVGSQRFGAHRLLVLQQANQSRHQSWTALPG